MRMKLVAASLLALGMASGAMAQSSTTTGAGSTSGTMMNSGTSNGTVTTPVDPSATNSTTGANTNSTGTVDRTNCTPQAAPGAVAAQNGNSGASESMACPDSDSQ